MLLTFGSSLFHWPMQDGKHHVQEDTCLPDLYSCRSDSHNWAAHNAGYGSDCWVWWDTDRERHRAPGFEDAGLALESISLPMRSLEVYRVAFGRLSTSI